MDAFGQMLLAGVLSGGVISTVVGMIFYRRGKAIEAEIESQVERGLAVFHSKRQWKERAISELLGPLHMQLDRTERAFERYTVKNLYLEAKIMGDGNLANRDLLLAKGHLIPPELIEDAALLIEHYDRWLEEFETRRIAQDPDSDSERLFVGPQGYPFPHVEGTRFREAFKNLWSELYAAD